MSTKTLAVSFKRIKNWLKEKRTILSYKDFKKFLNEIKLEMNINTENLTSRDGNSKFLLDRYKKINWKVEKCERFSTGIEGKEKQKEDLQL